MYLIPKFEIYYHNLKCRVNIILQSIQLFKHQIQFGRWNGTLGCGREEIIEVVGMIVRSQSECKESGWGCEMVNRERVMDIGGGDCLMAKEEDDGGGDDCDGDRNSNGDGIRVLR